MQLARHMRALVARADDEQLQRPAHWDTGFIRRFMTPLRSDQLHLRLRHVRDHDLGLDAHAPLFGLGWFVESLSTQSLVIFPIRTRRIPFFHSRPSTPLVVATAICVTIGVALPYSPLAHVLGFTALPVSFLAALVAMIIVYFGLVELGTRRFCRIPSEGVPIARPRPDRKHSIHRRASRWTTHTSSRHPIPAHVP